MFTLYGQISEMPSAIGAASGCPCISGSRMSGKAVLGHVLSKGLRKQLWRIEKSHCDFSSQLDTQPANLPDI
jgi:hypothetical protein